MPSSIFVPIRQAHTFPDGSARIYITPPTQIFPRARTQVVDLTRDQYERFLDYTRSRSMLIQDALPDLSLDDREKLLSGLTSEDLANL